ncbi:alpha/beta fold hydrolase [Butyrivibrio sp. JL13D10]|uniref:alpha/beta fold hydrolase n=1 Tax=Butyrivibrio sp. JL13D10 TaxID=3236815 RepID=UPI0038B42EF9
MARKEELTYKSRDRETTIHAIRWIPDEKPIAILQIIHGMQEYIDRYDEFANYLANNGIMVMGNDHLGHGDSVSTRVPYGYFCKNDPATVILRDAHRLKKMTQEEYPGIPVVLLGHSFGSFVAREYLTRYGTGIQGAIIQGTGWQGPGTIKTGKTLCAILGAFFGEKHRSNFMNNMAFKSYNSRISSPKSKFDWLSHNEESVKKYENDPKDNFVFTINGFETLFELLSRVQDTGKMEDIPKKLPILLTAGKEDPVGEYGKSVEHLYGIWKDQIGLQNLEIKLYDGMRHELQQEIGREKVFSDQLEWIKKTIAG